jgi:NAD(P)-dependent dehydrogenase (short-subunit alcohol dehydrogenase family)
VLAGRHAIVTGAASGIGAAAARALDDAGASVTRLDVSAGDGIIACDVTDEHAVESAFADATPFTDVLHAGGIMSTGEVSTLPLSDFRHVIDVNLIGSFLVARASARRIADRGTITLVASQAGRKGGAGWSAYCASKFGLIGLVESLAQELATREVRVNAVCPGTIDTPMTRLAINQLADRRTVTPGDIRDDYLAGIPFGRFGTAAEVASVCVFLASPLAAYVSGASIVVDGAELS